MRARWNEVACTAECSDCQVGRLVEAIETGKLDNTLITCIAGKIGSTPEVTCTASWKPRMLEGLDAATGLGAASSDGMRRFEICGVVVPARGGSGRHGSATEASADKLAKSTVM
jgi:cytochrome c5